MMMNKLINKIISKCLGHVEYVVTFISVDGEISRKIFQTIKEVDDFVIVINGETYHEVQKIEKFRRYSFKYNKNIIYTFSEA